MATASADNRTEQLLPVRRVCLRHLTRITHGGFSKEGYPRKLLTYVDHQWIMLRDYKRTISRNSHINVSARGPAPLRCEAQL